MPDPVMQHNPTIKAFLKYLKKKGKTGMVAMITVERKLLIYLNSLVKKEIYGI